MDNIIKETTTSVKEYDKKGRLVKETITVVQEKDRPTNYPYTWTSGGAINVASTDNIKYGSE